METLIISSEDEQGISLAGEIIRKGGLVAFPTETVYGLGANALMSDAAKKVYEAKGRPSDNPLIVHLADPEDAEKYAVTSPVYYKLAEAFMPGPLTFILPKKDVIPYGVTGGLSTVGIRIPSNNTANALIRAAGVPIAAPSANLSGKPSTTTAAHVIADLYGSIDAIIDGGEAEIGLESTIITEDHGKIRMLRPGAVTKEMIEAHGFEVILDKAVTEKLDAGEKPLAPGMKYRHYAPSAEVTLIDGNTDNVNRYLAGFGDRDDTAIICYSDDTELTEFENSFVIGARADKENTAHRLFSLLRELDTRKEIKYIYSSVPDTTDIGLAIFNRLVKAAGYRIIKTEQDN